MFEHDLFRKPDPISRDHALGPGLNQLAVALHPMALQIFLEHRHREGDIAMRGAVDHALVDDRRPPRSKGRELFSQHIGDVRGSIRTGPQLGHCDDVLALLRSQPVKPDFEESLVQTLQRRNCCDNNIVSVDRRSLCCVPRLIAPLLKEVRVPLGTLHNSGECGLVYCFSLCLDWLSDRLLGCGDIKRIDLWKYKQSFGIRFRISRQRRDLRQTRAKEEDRKGLLVDPMNSDNKCRKLFGGEVLHFVNQKGPPAFGCLGCLPHSQKEIRDVIFDVAAISDAGFWIDGNGDVAHLNLEGARKRTQRAQRRVGRCLRALHNGQSAQDLVHAWVQELDERSIFWRLDKRGEVTMAFSDLLNLVKKHRLAYASQPQEHLRLRWFSSENSLQCDVRSRNYVVTAGKLGRLGARSRGKWVSNGVHGIPLYRRL
ncbi:hypothetical protein MESS4_120039 [Mesorhizobium sp. STM 4661]|nr:hypothetical protein MESS4_120039 [Mesorhizobium sp. STM 4661]